MAKKVWTKAARKAFAAKMKAARAARAAVSRTVPRGRRRRRKKNPTKEQVSNAAKKIAKKAASIAWRTARFSGRVAGRTARSAARTAAAEVKASICRPRGANPRKRRRRRNPGVVRYHRRGAIVLRAQQGHTRLYYDGRHFSSKNRAAEFSSVEAAAIVGRRLLKTYPVLRHYKVAVYKME
jgi:methionyl-tRNA formyltransferase